ncbi:hypothetical protein [Pseudomonas sp. ANT_H12B]|uniref:hypothetical protein n=1 Tax=Pseudomonas sp. ANT_H12B TaxID=2597348 RepID=UPI0011EC38E4|nr:hypothetical protein [Pseudomonas sp. ANT_H12B]KAA0972811.1 hypothetical protein FQ185_14040 [Pseudomonas sp. ANT_H12B]
MSCFSNVRAHIASQSQLVDLQQLPEPDRQQTRKALLGYLNKDGKVEPVDASVPPALEQARKEAHAEAFKFAKYQSATPDFTAHSRASDEADRRYYTHQKARQGLHLGGLFCTRAV